ncbi:phosphoenolpyruvate synthase [Methanosarcina sp.]|uniref:phosphoenolpyruvate synthase n=1 Tax=Methanosarcina sp. TaxID=2213 RepID=UPI0029894FE2|nr:phosphoenolpyruvate synthase [Methanosarcina sp.]MDW5550400.1 phosphoenolpyruvate synthase [Methanosarcina sp.]MDW5554724.1 phosphoenolpyruvate synthase [Methanosarcina sp.]MDW5559977.1 phosphoenolpyruvate synthase [Methanosarcina sp.]
MSVYVMHFNEVDRTNLSEVGGKGANLGEMAKAGFPVPPGFCITTSAYRDFIAASSEMDRFFDLLDQLKPDQPEEIIKLGKLIRDHLLTIPISQTIKLSILDAWKVLGEERAYAVRSSATAEDLPTASFAGQQETYLNVKGIDQLLQAVRKCWSSLFTDRAIIYRIKNGFGHRSVYLSVVVQQMIFPEVSGLMFTVDPVTGHRNIISIDASFGLGEALVSGTVSADSYQVLKGKIIKKQIAEKKIAIYPITEGGTITRELAPELQKRQALNDDKILELAQFGQEIEKHYCSEQDVEWCLAGDKFYILQSRPITSLYPIPKVYDNKLHVFLSIAHLQMMTDAMRPMGISVFRGIFPFGKYSVSFPNPVITEAGDRLFFDVTPLLYNKTSRRYFIWRISIVDELMRDALVKIVSSEIFQQEAKANKNTMKQVFNLFKPMLPLYLKGIPVIVNNLFFLEPSGIIERATAPLEHIIDKYRYSIIQVSGLKRIKKVQESTGKLLQELNGSMIYVLLSFIVLPIANNLARLWLGEDLDVDTLSKSSPGNVTGEMGLMIGDMADTARKYPEVIDYLERAEDRTFYQGLGKVKGGDTFRAELDRFMELYGMRCPGEIDISNIRWWEAPTLLVPSIINHIKSNAPREHRDRFRQGRKEAQEAIQKLLAGIGNTPAGNFKARLMSRLLFIYRNSTGLREFPKYVIVRFFDIYRQAILAEARVLHQRGILEREEDVFYLYLDEFVALLDKRFNEDLKELIESRKRAYEQYQKMTPPRVMTSEGEVITGVRSDVEAPKGALIGTPVSAGVAEGYVKVILKPEAAKLNKGDILVAPFTDPGWTPLFYSVEALVVEIGGMMTHGSVIAREYGIPAVVGIENATKILKDGQYVRVDGTRGFVQVLK